VNSAQLLLKGGSILPARCLLAHGTLRAVNFNQPRRERKWGSLRAAPPMPARGYAVVLVNAPRARYGHESCHRHCGTATKLAHRSQRAVALVAVARCGGVHVSPQRHKRGNANVVLHAHVCLGKRSLSSLASDIPPRRPLMPDRNAWSIAPQFSSVPSTDPDRFVGGFP
jgi:hypothetical protein